MEITRYNSTDMDQDLTNPLVSVNIATYNRGRFISQAIDSVLAQTLKDWELIIVDDGSTDGTEQIIAPYLADPRIKYLKNPVNRHISFTRNRALSESRGEFIAILDSDDYWLDPAKLRRQIDFLRAHQDHLLVGSSAQAVDKNDRHLQRITVPCPDRSIREKLLKKNQIIHSTVLYRRQPVLESGAYNLNYNGIEDYDLWLRLGTLGRLANLPEATTAYRVHGSNISLTDRLRLMRINLELIKQNRNNYPGFTIAYLRRELRYLLYAAYQKLFNPRAGK